MVTAVGRVNQFSHCGSMEVSQKTKWRWIFHMTLLPLYPKHCKPAHHGDTCTPVFTESLLAIANLWNQLRCPKPEAWIRDIYTYIYIYEFSAIKNNEAMTFARKHTQL